ncbi:hypothetical protein FHG87_007000 [Trinorchestia longiramus]|nr:hypothetical protein FHG87_007000 [Trinorchestia longiramus]
MISLQEKLFPLQSFALISHRPEGPETRSAAVIDSRFSSTVAVPGPTLRSSIVGSNSTAYLQEESVGAFGISQPKCTHLFFCLFTPVTSFLKIRTTFDPPENLCSKVAHLRGPNQTVYAYSYAAPASGVDINSDNFKRHLDPIRKRSTKIQTSCPHCFIRLYHNISEGDDAGRNFLCNLFGHHLNVDFCDVTSIPILHGTPPYSWTLASLGDPDVDVFFDRHIENTLLDREWTAVEEWKQSGRAAHVMRDYPTHRAAIIPGLWSVRNSSSQTLAVARRRVLNELRQNLSSMESALETYIWPLIKNSVLQHDSYHCNSKSHNGSIPFSTQRENGRFCGWGNYKTKERQFISLTPCPEQCRPSDHKDWWFC